MIKDSGNRTEFASGAVRDIQTDKGREDLLPLDIVAELLNDDCLACIDKFEHDGDYHNLLNAVLAFDGFENIYDAMLNYGNHMQEGCNKYGDRNWEKGIPLQRYVDSAVRHYLKYRRGDTDERHDRAFIWNCLCGAWTVKHKPELNDYPLEL